VPRGWTNLLESIVVFVRDEISIPYLGEEDGLLLSADRSPNLRGLLLNGLIDAYPPEDLALLGEAIDRGEVDTVFCLREDLGRSGLTDEQIAKVILIQATSGSEVPQAALSIPLLTVFEREGTFVNQQFRLQRFERAIPGPEGILPDTVLLGSILDGLAGSEEASPVTLSGIWTRFLGSIPELDGQSRVTIGDEGVQIPAGRFAAIAFPERKTLKYEAETFFENATEPSSQQPAGQA